MTVPSPDPDRTTPSPGPAWASALGVVAVLLGVFMASVHANEWMRHGVIGVPAGAEVRLPPADCPEDELEEEGLSAAECEELVGGVRGFMVSRPDWFRGFQMGLSAVGLLVALVSIVVGIALVDYRAWAPAAAVATFGALTAIDLLEFLAAINTGPILRGIYLWGTLVWFFIHLTLTVAAVAGRDSARKGPAIA